MKLSDLEAANQATLKSIREIGGIGGEAAAQNYPYFGYYEVDIFESPPFLMFTGNDCPRAWDILFNRHFEPQSMKVWCRLARTATGILDIGAHVGVYSLAAAAIRPDLKVHAFEPNPNAYTRVRMHKIINRFEKIVEHWFAVGSDNQLVKFSWVKKPTLQISSGAGIGVRNRPDAETIVVEMKKLDGTGIASTLGDKPLVKIDVEGAEVATLSGMQEVLALKPDIILETFAQGACDRINPMIEPLGYRVYHILEKENQLVRHERLEACSVQSGNFNQLLTTRSHEEIEALLQAPAAY